MNQRLCAVHVGQLTPEQQQSLRQAWTPEEGEYIALGSHEEMIYFLNGFEKHKALPLMTIGQMITFIHTRASGLSIRSDDGGWIAGTDADECRAEELCDALWELMKKLL